MKTLHPDLQKFVNKHFNALQKEKAQYWIKFAGNKHLTSYTILSIAVEDELIDGNAELIKEFYNVKDMSKLSAVDVVIAKLITTLSKLTNSNVKANYYKNLTLDKTQPELKYLIKVVDEYLLLKW